MVWVYGLGSRVLVSVWYALAACIFEESSFRYFGKPEYLE